MYYNLIRNYIEKLTRDDIKNYALKEGIELNEEELNVLYSYIKLHWKTFYYGNPKELLEELKTKLSEVAYMKVIHLYKEFKEKIS